MSFRPLVVLAVFCAGNLAWAADDGEEWAKLTARREQLVGQLQKMQADFRQSTDPAERMKIAEQFEKVREEFTTKLLPRMRTLAPKVFAADPKNTSAGEAALEIAFEENRFEDAAKLSDQLLAVDKESMIALNMGGVSLFAIHRFDQAHDRLEQAKDAGVLHPQLGGRYLEDSGKYADFWKKEQAIRAKEAAAKGDQQLPRVEFDTSKGKIVFELFENEAPNTVANFISLVESGNYDKSKFHRVIPLFMAQGGDPLSKDENPANDGTGGPGYVIDCECYRPDARMHFRGSLSMAHAGKDTGGSQFFITHLPTSHLNPNAEVERGHTVFGRVVEGMDVAAALEIGDEIRSAKVLRKRNHVYKPVTKPDPNK